MTFSPGIPLRLNILLASLASNKTRTVLAASLITLGIAATLVTLSLSTGVRLELESIQATTGRDLFIIKAADRQIPPWQAPGWYTTTKLKPIDASLVRTQIHTISQVAPVLERNLPVKWGNTGLTTMIRGITPTYLYVRNFQLESGRAFTPADDASMRRVAVIGAFIAERLNNGLGMIGETLWVNGMPFEVIGQLRAKGQGSDGSNEDDQILIPLRTAMRRVANVDSISMLIAQARTADDLPRAMESTRQLLRTTHHLDADERDDFDLLTMIRADEVRRLSSQWLQSLARILAAITLAIGGVGIFAVSYMNVSDRVAEIGLRMAIGASRASIAALFLAEALVISALGGVAGLIVGAAAAFVLEQVTAWHMPLDTRGIFTALAVAASIGILFSLAPAIRASLLRPATALANE
jgi:ABC-type antimicrobial peptide transport system permease subunit